MYVVHEQNSRTSKQSDWHNNFSFANMFLFTSISDVMSSQYYY